MKSLNGKVALVTGSAQGIGKTIVERFLSEGADIALCDFNREMVNATAGELSGKSGKVKPFYMNVADETSVNEGLAEIIEEFGRVDILVNNAGITRDNLMMRMKKEDWDAVINVNLTGTFNVTKAVIKYMIKERYGCIINIASVGCIVGNGVQVND